MKFEIKAYEDLKHRDQVVSLWQEVFGYEAAYNAPELVIDKKLDFDDGLFFVATCNESVVGTVMAGYDGHRGWIYLMAVSPNSRNQGLGSKLIAFVEEKLSKRGCLKVNLQILEGNESVEKFYLQNGYRTEKRISMGKRMQ